MKSYLKYLGIHLKSSLEYKTSFILSIISQIIVFFSYYFSVIALFERFSNIKGYTLYEVLLTFAIIQIGFACIEIFARGLDRFDTLIVSGNFETLTKTSKSNITNLLPTNSNRKIRKIDPSNYYLSIFTS